jgi:hypothetical protein
LLFPRERRRKIHTRTGVLSPETAESARALIQQLPECFWFWNRDAAIETTEDARLGVRNLREYGGHRARREAQRLHSCF